MFNTIERLEKEQCCGCRSCEQICPKSCISMFADDEGFLVPQINKELCINCGLCVNHCPMLSDEKKEVMPHVYAAKNKNKEVLLDSTSGGIFDALARIILEKNGTVFGCAWSESLVAEHIEISNVNDLEKLHGSKYVQSDTKNTYTRVKNLLLQNQYVLYSGTSCQIAGLKSFLNEDFEKLFTIDIICHGVPSPILFKKYKKWLSIKMGSPIIFYDFRSKEKNAWGLTYKAKTKTKTKTKYLTAYLDPYYAAFLKGETYRECCYKCKYSNKNKPSDITLGDFWGIENQHPEFFDDKGVSIAIVNTNKGHIVFDSIKENINYINSEYDRASFNNMNLIKATVRPDIRDDIYVNIKGISENELFEEKLKVDIKLYKKIKYIIPYKIKKFLKKI